MTWMEEQIVDIFPMGDRAVVFQFEHTIDVKVNELVHQMKYTITQCALEGIETLIPSFNNLTIVYNPSIQTYDSVVHQILQLRYEEQPDMWQTKTIHLPVVFNATYGPDLSLIAERANQTVEEVVNYFTSHSFYTYMIGFIAGYPYSGDIAECYALPRRKEPRLRVPKGTIQIANRMTGISTLTSPSGWHMIGWTPMDMFDPYATPPTTVQAGTLIRYVAITEEEAVNWNDHVQREWNAKWNV